MPTWQPAWTAGQNQHRCPGLSGDRPCWPSAGPQHAVERLRRLRCAVHPARARQSAELVQQGMTAASLLWCLGPPDCKFGYLQGACRGWQRYAPGCICAEWAQLLVSTALASSASSQQQQMDAHLHHVEMPARRMCMACPGHGRLHEGPAGPSGRCSHPLCTGCSSHLPAGAMQHLRGCALRQAGAKRRGL